MNLKPGPAISKAIEVVLEKKDKCCEKGAIIYCDNDADLVMLACAIEDLREAYENK